CALVSNPTYSIALHRNENPPAPHLTGTSANCPSQPNPQSRQPQSCTCDIHQYPRISASGDTDEDQPNADSGTPSVFSMGESRPRTGEPP
ncbi:hypothetical protein K6U45_06680, partial [Vibrio vulnificus]|nr:hypothetical protein [Vibrio vulnificus]